MSEEEIYQLAEVAQEAQTKIQQDYNHIDPIIGVITSLRAAGIPADGVTIDCLKTKKRIALILHDNDPKIVAYQFGYSDRDSDSEHNTMSLQRVTAAQIYRWVETYFLP